MVTRRRKKNRRQTKTHRTRRQQGGTQDEKILTLLQHYFPEFPEGHIRVNNGHVFLTCPLSPDSNVNTDPDPNFIHFQITDNRMMLHYLKRCSTIHGTDILQRIIMIGRDLSLHTIELDDASRVGCDYPLYTLSILQHGETWYHRMGFRYSRSVEDKKEQDRLRHLPFDEFVKVMILKYDAQNMKENTKTRTRDARIMKKNTKTIDGRVRAYLNTWYNMFPVIKRKKRDPVTVIDVVRAIRWKDIKCDDSRATFLRNFLDMADNALPYESHVTLDLRQQNTS